MLIKLDKNLKVVQLFIQYIEKKIDQNVRDSSYIEFDALVFSTGKVAERRERTTGEGGVFFNFSVQDTLWQIV